VGEWVTAEALSRSRGIYDAMETTREEGICRPPRGIRRRLPRRETGILPKIALPNP